MAIVNPQLMVGWDTNDTNSVAPDPTIISNGYPFQGIPASSEHNYIFGNVLDNLNFLKESGLYRWDPTITYKKQAMIARDEFVYFSLTDGNTGNDPLVSPSSWIDWVSLSNASWKTTGVTNAGSISTILATPYFGTASAPSDGDVLSIRITTGEITFPSNVKINIDGSDYTLVGTVPFSGSDSTLRILDVYFDGTNFNLKNSLNDNIHIATSKTTPVDADELALADSESSFLLKKLTLSNLKATIFTSPALTGSPTAPTQLSSDDSTKIATTAWSKFGLSYSMGANGYMKLPAWMGGFIFQWGAYSAVDLDAVSFPTPFPNSCFGVFNTLTENVGLNESAYVRSYTNTNFVHSFNAGGTHTFRYFAVGY
jgi:hypothetical protein